jgi:DNA polymerase-3 subunit delta'
MLIWLPEKMNTAAANKLLKILEEPPQMTVFLLISHHAENLLATIQSRLQWIYVPRIDDDSVSEFLVKTHGTDIENARLVASLSEGNLNRAIQIIQNNEGVSSGTTLFVEWVRACYKPDYPKLVKWTEEISRLGREHQKDFLRLSISMMRDALLHHYGLGVLERMGISQKTFDLTKFAPFIHSGNIENIIEELSRSHYEIERNANPKIVFMDTSLRLSQLLRVAEPA